MPLVECWLWLDEDKDKFNASSKPANDGRRNLPTMTLIQPLPTLSEVLFRAATGGAVDNLLAPSRADSVNLHAVGYSGLNQQKMRKHLKCYA